MLDMVCTLPFLGQRAYLQGTTLFEALTPHVQSWEDVLFKIPAPLRTNTLRICHQPVEDQTPCAHVQYTHQNERRCLYVYPLEICHPVQREPFDEQRLVAQGVFYENTADFSAPWVYSFVKTVVALNKALLQRMHPEKNQGQWVFTALELHAQPQEAPLHLAVTAVLSGGRLTSTELHLAGQCIGSLLFSWLPRPLGN